jgi:membrane fusion protein (multidrug efflux system)
MPVSSTLFGSGTGRVVRVTAVLIVLAAGSYWGYRWFDYRTRHVFENDARIAADMIAISSRIPGFVTETAVGQGDRVNAGDVLVRIDAREARHKLDELEAHVRSIRAEREVLLAQIAMIESQTKHRISAQRHRGDAGQAAVEAAKARVEMLDSEFARIRSLAANRIVSQQRLEQVEADRRDARERLREAIADQAAVESQLLEARAAGQEAEVLRRRLDKLAAEEQRFEAMVEQQRIDLDDRDIASPVKGVVDKVFVEAGEYVRAGQRMMLVHDPGDVWVDANIRETDLRHVRLGATVYVHVDAFPDQVLAGKVVRIGDAATSQFALLPNPNPSGNFTKVSQRVPVKILVEHDGVVLRPGTMVEIEIVIDKRGGAGAE